MTYQNLIIEEGALLDLLLPAIECAVSPVRDGSTNEGLEVAGVLWGAADESSGMLSIRKASVIRLGHQEAGEVGIPDASIELMKRVAATHWPHLRYLGSFHTHPYLHLGESDPFILEKGHKHSPDDKVLFREAQDDEINIIMTIVRAKRNRIPGGYLEIGGQDDFSAAVIRFGGLAVIIKAYRKTPKGQISSHLTLICPAITGALMPAGDVFSPFLA